MTCQYYAEDGKCNLPKNLYCGQVNEYGFCMSHGVLDRDDPV